MSNMFEFFGLALLSSGLAAVCADSHHSHGHGHSGSGSTHISFPTGCGNCDCQEYKNLMALGGSNSFVDENRVFVMLKALNDISHDCRRRAIEHLNGVYSGMRDTPTSCHCSGHNKFSKYHQHQHENLNTCLQDNEFHEFYNYYFKHHSGEPHHPPACRSHHAIWKTLNHVHSSGSMSCQGMIIDNIGLLFQNSDPCSCAEYVSTTPSTTSTQTTTAPTKITRSTTETSRTTTITPTTTTPTVPTTTTKQQPTATTKPTTGKPLISVRWSCGKLSTIESIALQQHLNQTSATLCDPANQGGSDEAFVLINCNTPDPSLWRQGVNVMQHCHDIPTYTPVATFVGGTYLSSRAESGVFLGCINDGFKLGVQHCNSTPTIDHITVTSHGLQRADLYYVIE